MVSEEAPGALYVRVDRARRWRGRRVRAADAER
jgi:hypothetical protein